MGEGGQLSLAHSNSEAQLAQVASSLIRAESCILAMVLCGSWLCPSALFSMMPSCHFLVLITKESKVLLLFLC
jgi:hypothetical protein